MSIEKSVDLSAWHERYRAMVAKSEAGDADAQELHRIIDTAADRVMKTFKADDYQAACDDPAEELVAAITRYFVRSNPSFHPLFREAEAVA